VFAIAVRFGMDLGASVVLRGKFFFLAVVNAQAVTFWLEMDAIRCSRCIVLLLAIRSGMGVAVFAIQDLQWWGLTAFAMDWWSTGRATSVTVWRIRSG
jgi:hypothetical protein